MSGRRAVAAVLLALLVPAAAGAGTLRYASQDDPQTLDPHSANLLAASRVTSQVYEPLVWRDRNWKPIPWLATSWTRQGDKAWRFKLREGVKFHDGSAFTADDVVFSVGRALEPTSQLRTAVQGVERARKIDPLTVELVLKEPNPALLQHLTNLRIMSRAWAVKHRSEKPQDYKNKEDTYAARNANGTGPFMVKAREPDVRTVLLAHKDWWGRKAGASHGGDPPAAHPLGDEEERDGVVLAGEHRVFPSGEDGLTVTTLSPGPPALIFLSQRGPRGEGRAFLPPPWGRAGEGVA